MAKEIDINENNEIQKKSFEEINLSPNDIKKEADNINPQEDNEFQKRAGTEITVVHDDLKKDLTNFLVGLSSVTNDPNFFEEFQDLVAKTLSPTMDINSFTDELLQLLKNNTIKDTRGIDFAPTVRTEKDTKVVTHTGRDEGDSVSVGTFASNNPRTFASSQTEIIPSTHAEDAEKESDEINNNLTQKATSAFVSKTAGQKDVNVNTLAEERKKSNAVNPTYSGFNNEGAPISSVGNYLNNEGDRGNNPNIGVEQEINPKLSSINSLDVNVNRARLNNKNEEEVSPELTTGTPKDGSEVSLSLVTGATKDDSIISPNLTTRTPKDGSEVNPTLSTGNAKTDEIIDTTANNIIQEALRRKRGVNELDVLLYNAIPYGIGGTMSSLAGLAKEINTFREPTDIFSSNLLNVFNVTGGISEAYRLFTQKGYFTMDEIAYFYGLANFYTLNFRRGITIKDFRTPDVIEGGLRVAHVEPQNILQPKIKFNTPTTNLLRPVLPPEFYIGLISGRAIELGEPKTYPNTSSGESISDITEAYKDIGSAKEEDPNSLKSQSYHEYSFPEVEAGDITIDIKELGTASSSTFSPSYVRDARIDSTNTINRSDLSKELKNKEGIWQIGSIYVWPVSGTPSPGYIPFQFNPSLTEGGVNARYNAQSVLSRIGNLQSFTGVDSLTVTLETSYFAVSRDENDAFDLHDIQIIELAYRALNLPWYDATNNEEGYNYYKPPLLKVLMGDRKKVEEVGKAGNGIYSNLLTYPDDVLGTNNLKSQNKLRHFKTFIATNITITKDIMEMPLYIDDENVLRDTFGFNVNMNLIEVSSSYFDTMPHFRDYYDVAYNYIQTAGELE